MQSPNAKRFEMLKWIGARIRQPTDDQTDSSNISNAADREQHLLQSAVWYVVGRVLACCCWRRRRGGRLKQAAALVDVAVHQVDEQVLAAEARRHLRHPPRVAPHPPVVIHLPRVLDRRAVPVVRGEGEAAGPRREAGAVDRDGHRDAAVQVRHPKALCWHHMIAVAVHGTAVNCQALAC